MKKIDVVVLGLGYIGLPTAALIACKGMNVHGVDIKHDVVKAVNDGKILVKEPDLENLVKMVVKTRRLRADLQPLESSFFIIAVPTPLKRNYTPDVTFVENAISMIIPFLKEGNCIIIESTVPVGTTRRISNFILSKRPELAEKIYVAYCPERVLPGNILYELEYNERTIGGIDEASCNSAMNLYSLFVKGNLNKTKAEIAELCKLFENAYRDVNIAFANEVSMICNKIGVDAWETISLANKHPRVNILNPGPGVGGHCIAVDPWFIIHDFTEEAALIHTARLVNKKKTDWILTIIRKTIANFREFKKRQPVVACFGLTYKPNVDDLRESPALSIAEKLLSEDIDLVIVEPNIHAHPRFRLVEYGKALEISDIIVFLVAHREFFVIDFLDKILLDFCGISIDARNTS